MDRYLKYFIKPLSESRQPNVKSIYEDDIKFLEYIGNYIYEKRVDKKEAINTLNYGLKTASRRSELFNEIQRTSQDRLANHTSIFAGVDISNFNEDEIGGLLQSSCSWMSNIISGTTDGSVLSERAIGEYNFNPENTLVYMPVISEWLENYLMESQHSIAIREFLNSVKDALEMDKNQHEIIAKHEPENQGKITYVK